MFLLTISHWHYTATRYKNAVDINGWSEIFDKTAFHSVWRWPNNYTNPSSCFIAILTNRYFDNRLNRNLTLMNSIGLSSRKKGVHFFVLSDIYDSNGIQNSRKESLYLNYDGNSLKWLTAFNKLLHIINHLKIYRYY